MDTLTRRRLVAIGLSLAGLAVLPRIGRTQMQAAPKVVPACPTKTGAIGDWQWTARSYGWSLRAKVVKLIEQGDFIGEPSKGFSLSQVGNGTWSLYLRVARRPTSKSISIIVSGGGRSANGSVPVSAFKPLQVPNEVSVISSGTSATGTVPRPTIEPPKEQGGSSHYLLIDVAAVLGAKHVDPAQSNEIAFEFVDGKRTLCKLAVGARGFTAAQQKANVEVRQIKAMLASGACEEPDPLDDD